MVAAVDVGGARQWRAMSWGGVVNTGPNSNQTKLKRAGHRYRGTRGLRAGTAALS